MKKTPRPHQQEAIEKGIAYFQDHDRGKLIMACGTGKTLAALWIGEALKAKNIIIGVPSLALQDQYCMSFLAELDSDEFDIIAIGSDQSLEKTANIEVTTNLVHIVNFLKKEGKKKIIFTTYQSTPQLFEAVKTTNFVCDYCIIDEAHRTAGFEFSLFSGIISDDNMPCKKRLFMTATPRLFKDEQLLSMDNIDIYGQEIYRLDTDEAIKREILSDYKVVVLYCNDLSVEKAFKFQPNNKKVGDVIANDRYFSMAAALQIAIEKYQLRRIVTFHKSIKLAENMQTLITQIFPSQYQAFHVNFNHKIDERKEILKQMRQSEIGIVTNAKALGEGWDMPECDGVGLIDAKKSAFEIIQIIGRILRRHETKMQGIVLIPVLINEKGIVNPKDFDNLRIALTSIGVMDKRVSDYFKTGAYAKGVTPIIEGLKPKNSPPNIDFEGLMKTLSLRVWDRLKMTQWRPFDELREWAINTLKPKGIDSSIKYRQYLRDNPSLTKDIPIAIENTYAEWQGWEHFFDKKEKWDIYSYEEAKEVLAQYPQINSLPKYLKWRSGEMEDMPPFPEKLPASPSKTYASKWRGYFDYFSYSPDTTEPFSYNEAVDWVAENLLPLGINNRTKFYKWLKDKTEPFKPKGLSTIPDKIYKDEWQGWEMFFGKRKTTNIDYWSYEEAKKWVAENLVPLGIDSFIKWGAYMRNEYSDAPLRPIGMPSDLKKIPQWQGYDLFFGKQKYYKDWLTYEEAKIEAQKVAKLGVNNSNKWKQWQKGLLLKDYPYPERMPKSYIPHVYAEQWEDWERFFGKVDKAEKEIIDPSVLTNLVSNIIAFLLETSLSVNQIKNKLNVSSFEVKESINAIKKNPNFYIYENRGLFHLSLKSQQRRDNLTSKVKELWAGGLTRIEIAQKLEVNTLEVSQVLSKLAKNNEVETMTDTERIILRCINNKILDVSEMMKATKKSRHGISMLLSRLRKEGKIDYSVVVKNGNLDISPKKERVKKELGHYLNTVLELHRQNKNKHEIATLIGKEPKYVAAILSYAKKNGHI
jgi:superfamily II DNA or RNA helicase